MLLTERLHNHRLSANPLGAPVDVVRWFGAVQAQDFAGALWALGQRVTPQSGEADVLAAFDAGALIRTHVLRPTWHLVTPEDLRWMLALTGPRIQAGNTARYTELGLDAATRAKAVRAFGKALQRSAHLTRQQLADVLRSTGIDPGGQRLIHLLMHAELEAVICSGPRVGRQFTYALVDARVPATPPRERDDALAALMGRYFSSHGPATIRDAAWWSGLPLGEVRKGLALAGDRLTRLTIADVEHWGPAGSVPGPRTSVRPRAAATASPAVHLLSSYDEYTVGYRDRTSLLHPSTIVSSQTQMALLSQPVMVDGRHVGGWKRVVPTRISAPVVVEVRLLERLSRTHTRALDDAVARYAAFLGRGVTLAVS